ncbi:MAG: FAD:protein transferase [Thermoleophilaceae bacterium]|nr:FAD:protein transferase [Thermoleophilaceae bacterium]
MKRHDETFACMGTTVRVLIEDSEQDPSTAGAWARAHLEAAAARLTRFDEGSELSRFNASPDPAPVASALLRAAVGAALWAAAATDGLVDPTLHGAIRRAGYRTSRAGAAPAPLADALACAPARAPARPNRTARWREVRLAADRIERPPGVELDTGGTTKGLLADSVAHVLAGYDAFVVDCGGDMRIGGRARTARDVIVEHPLHPSDATTLTVSSGGVATSGIGRRLWPRPGGGAAHHLLDPATGEPAWTGLIAATALAPTALEAEARAKAALLDGPGDAPARLAPHGGVLIHDDGTVLHVAPAPTLLAPVA